GRIRRLRPDLRAGGGTDRRDRGRLLLRRATGQDGPARPRRVAESPNLPFPASGGGYGGRAAHPSYNDQHNMAVKIRVPGALRQLTRGAAIVEVDAGDVSH